MQFRIKKELKEGRYYVIIELSEFTESDKEKFKIFGEPTIVIKTETGKDSKSRVTRFPSISPYGFYKQEEADQYVENLKIQIKELRERWDNLKDTWSNEEII
ncbi:MAG TPA: hypothetical protein VK179_16380 [Bacteroidales bacterium]|nr:hypothetical protein [Bacteroidales bacterium]